MIDAPQQLAQGFAQHIVRWAERRGCDAATKNVLHNAALELSIAISEGHVCVASDPAQRACLLASGLVGTPEAPGALPLLLDGDDRLYLHRYFDDEQRLARRLVRAAHAPSEPAAAQAVALLDELFEANEARLAGGIDWQKRAALLALQKKLVIISGGPGTGKTSTVVNLLAGLLMQHAGLRIALAAPTGKARARLLEAVTQHAARLPEALRARLPNEAATIHRLLGERPDGTFVHDARNTLALDVLIVDEASMLDLSRARRLVEAVPEHGRIILLGDKEQLASVESGAVFAEISAQQGALRDCIVWFRDNFRFATDSGPGRLAADIVGGRANEAISWLRRGDEASVTWMEDIGRTLGSQSFHKLAAGFEPFFAHVCRDIAARAAILASFSAFRALCAVREGARGVDRINEFMDAHARVRLAAVLEEFGGDARSPWYAGRPVIVARNDYALNLMNGDVGITLPDENRDLKVFFDDGAGGLRAIAPARMPPHATAFATTVHKAQGSEFEEVILILPENASHTVSRELLYTAVTRARKHVTLCAGETVIRMAIDSPTRRISGLRARLASRD